jgi:hypothetical protein
MKIVAILLIAVGLVGLIYGGVTWTRREKVVDIGPVQVTREHEKSVPVPPIVGGICLVAGVVLLMKGRTASA